jgi:iron only hydrogenase large subunit-like protein
MPCTSKKFEAGLSAMQSSGHQDVDLVLTTRELCRMIRESEIDIESLPEEEFDDPLGMATGAGEIFGASGGVMEAALRTAHYLVTGANPDPDAFEGVRSGAGTRIAEVNLGGNVVRVGVAHGLKAAEDLIERLQSGELELHFVEVMACPGGCVSGGGQPIPLNREEERRPQRTSTLYKLDRRAEVRFAHESPTVQKLYDEFLGKPGSHKAHELLHTDQEQWQLISVGKK